MTKIVVHEIDSLRTISILNKFFLQGPGVGHDNIYIAFASNVQGRSGSSPNVTDPNPSLFSKASSRAATIPESMGPMVLDRRINDRSWANRKNGHKDQES